MMFDGYFSGTVVDLVNDSTNTSTTNSKVSETLGQVVMISGCKDNQTSADAYVNYSNVNISSGAMTFSFLKTLQDLGTNISLKILVQNMRSILKTNGYSQVPQLSSGTAIDIEKTILSL